MTIHRAVRAILPSFRFFNRVGDEPELWMRVLLATDETHTLEEPWQNALTPPSLNSCGVLLNPEWGMHHALCNSLNQFVDDLTHQSPTDKLETSELPSFKMLKYLLQQKIYRKWKGQQELPTLTFQFKVRWQGEDLLISDPGKITIC